MYFVCELGKIFKTNYISTNYEVISTYAMPAELATMVDVNKIDNYFYVSAGGIIVRTQDLNNLVMSNYENIYNIFGMVDIAYFISYFDNKIYIPEVGENQNSIIEINPSDMNDFDILYRFYGIKQDDIDRRELYPR